MNTQVVDRDLMLEIAKGNFVSHSQVNKFGSNSASAADAWEDISDLSANLTFPTTAVITSVSQTTDQVAMRSGVIEIQGLDASWNLVIQTVDLDASDTTTVVTLGTPLVRAFRAKVLADVVADSTIRVHNAGETTDYLVISTGENQTLHAAFTIPDGVTGYITNWYGGYVRDAVKDPDGIQFRLRFADRKNGYEFQTKHEKGVPKQSNGFQHFFRPYYKITERTDIKIDAYSDGAASHTHGGFDIILVNN